jgi:hypothetical protein
MATNLGAAKEVRAPWYEKMVLKSNKAEQSARKLMKVRTVNATPSSADTSSVPGIIQNTLAAGAQRSAPDVIDEFSAILTPLRMFSPSANIIQNVIAFVSNMYLCD